MRFAAVVFLFAYVGCCNANEENCQAAASCATIIQEDAEPDDSALLQTGKKEILHHSQPEPAPTEGSDTERNIPAPPAIALNKTRGKEWSIRESLDAEQQAAYDHLHSLLKAVKLNHVDAINSHALALLVRDSSPLHANVKLSDAQELVARADTSKDGKLQKNELDAMLEATIDDSPDADEDGDMAGEDAGEDEDAGEGEDVPDNGKEASSLIEYNRTTGRRGSGKWQDFQCCDDFHAKRYSLPKYFKPRKKYTGEYSVKACYVVGFVLSDSCWGYLYTNAVGSQSNGMCRCFPKEWEYFDSQGYPKISFYDSKSGNHVYCPYCR